MANVKLSAYGTLVTVLATELNSLANNNVSGLSGAGTGVIFDNTTNLNLYADFVLTVTFGVAPTAGNTCDLYAAWSADGTNYETMPGAGTTLPNAWQRVGSFSLQTAGTAQVMLLNRVPLSPGKAKFQLVNASGQAFPASGSTVGLYPYSLTVI